MMDGDVVTRGEFDLLRQMVVAGQSRVENIDDHGTRGIAALAAQVNEITKDVVALQSDVTSRFDAHNRQHDQDRKERISGRRWLIGTGIGGIGVLGGIVTLLIEVLQKLGH